MLAERFFARGTPKEDRDASCRSVKLIEWVAACAAIVLVTALMIATLLP